MQIGQGRGGMYSYERLEDLLGLDITNTDEISPEWQHLGVGGVEAVTPSPAGEPPPATRS